MLHVSKNANFFEKGIKNARLATLRRREIRRTRRRLPWIFTAAEGRILLHEKVPTREMQKFSADNFLRRFWKVFFSHTLYLMQNVASSN